MPKQSCILTFLQTYCTTRANRNADMAHLYTNAAEQKTLAGSHYSKIEQVASIDNAFIFCYFYNVKYTV